MRNAILLVSATTRSGMMSFMQNARTTKPEARYPAASQSLMASPCVDRVVRAIMRLKTVVDTKHLRADPLAQSGLRTEVFSVCAAQPHSMCESIQASLSGAISARSTADTVKPKRLNRHTTLNEVDGTSR